jgi:hypothetical protein
VSKYAKAVKGNPLYASAIRRFTGKAEAKRPSIDLLCEAD